MSSQHVHAWPLITLRYTDSGATATCGTRRADELTADAGSQQDAARLAAVQVCTMLGKERCRVEGIADDNSVHPMVVDALEETLEPLDRPNFQASASAIGGGAATRRPGSARRGRWGLPMTQRQKLYALVVALALVALIATGWSYFADRRKVEAQGPVAPAAAQLPVASPAGWSTYAVWSTEAEDVDPVLDGQGRVLTVEDDDVVARDATTGTEKQRISVPFRPDSLMTYVQGGQQRVAAASGRELAVWDQGADSFQRVELPEQAEVLVGGSEPLVVNRDQRAWVLDGHELQERIVPAGAEALSADDGAVIAGESKGSRVWKIVDSSAELPEPATVEAPKGYEVQGVSAAAGSLAAVDLKGKDDQRVTIVEVTAGDQSTTVTELMHETVKGTSGAGKPQWDPSRPVAVLGPVAVDFEGVTVAELPSTAEPGGGRIWIADSEKSEQFSVSGTQLDSGDGDGAVPSLITPGGLAVVVEDGRVYALSDEAPSKSAASSSPEASSPATNEEEDEK